ncbi:RluA family pseudouridine synthase [Flavilitoribacter nigricans]|uniref:RNA pseudouridine synthase n=1 Tax=Flavilitoribacter nigricans (strain ATCC 23147 / DSM 23189 / NBRC 102662 / NCIMB 1420 / SS-2) TaxID=1122177 RepID=A0A2D0MY69_FLAN2|nr:RNA pseudouridine synthase [Flavilitoribacter nigricans]PHN01078.1 RNA pseudouridine synthase [Flavilitoribacter nigricans DSM 23189 = NBRC 102662]
MSDEHDFSIGDLVIYKNNQLVAFNKPSGLAVQHDQGDNKSLHALGEIYTKGKLFIIHRLDQPASGVILFAKTPNALVSLNEQFRSRETQKTYLAVVGEMPAEPEGMLVHYLRKDGKQNKSQAYDKPSPGSKRAELSYKHLASSDRYHLLEVNLHTGRHHQIRAQLAAIGCPIKGDVKYGFRRSNRDRSIHLHAWKLNFVHPVSKEKESLQASLPANDPVWDAFGDQLQ